MAGLDPNRYRELAILNHVEETPRLNTRMAAHKLGVSVKLAHETLKRMVGKGWLHVKKCHSRRWDYFLTPEGVAEKARLTMEFLEFTMQFYRQARRRSADVCRDLAAAGIRHVALLGVNELAEIVSLGVREWALELTDVFDPDRSSGRFLGLEVRPACELGLSSAERTIVCLYDRADPLRREFLPEGLPRRPGMVWVFGQAQPSVREPGCVRSEGGAPS